MRKVAVGLSGGVDSAVSAALLVEQGYEVTGVFLECWRGPGCRVDEDRKDAMDVAMKLKIPFKVLDFKEEYKKKVVDYFYKEYDEGRTPNPDVMCNKEIKFGMFYEWAMENGFNFVATGHYARIRERQDLRGKKQEKQYDLLRGEDNKKDQSYFLYQLRQEQLGHILFPVGEMTKKEVRKKAEELGLSVAEKSDSQGICFIGQVSTREFLKDLGMEEKSGKVFLKVKGQKPKTRITSQNSKVEDLVEVGRHNGAWFYTVGQRSGFSIKDLRFKNSDQREQFESQYDLSNLPPLYVVSKDVKKNELVVGVREDLMQEEFGVGEIHWISPDDGLQNTDDSDLKVRIRHGGALVSTRLQMTDDGLQVKLEEPVFGVAEGQAAVFYRRDEVLGGGVIAV